MKQGFSAWAPIILLALTAFVFVSTEFVPVGILAALGQSFGMSAVDVGPMLTVYASVVALASLPAVLLFARFERKKLLLGLMAIFVVSHAICVFAPSYDVLLSGRIGIAFTHALFWAIAPALVVRLAPNNQGAKALSIFATGGVLALVLGIPLGRVIGQLIGWRSIFALIGLFTFIMMLLLWRGLPKLPATHGGNWRSLPSLIKNKALISLFVLTVCLVTAHYSVYTYLEPLLQEHFGYSAGITTLVLLIFGAAGLIASVLFSHFYGNHGQSLIIAAIAAIGSCMAILPTAAQSITLLVPLCIIWGTALMLLCLSLQAKALKLAPEATDVAMAIYSGLFNVGIGSGALIGSLVAINYGVQNNGYWASGLILIAIIPLSYFIKLRRQQVAHAM
ncbi:MAG: sugar transporter [Shewanella sp.]